jgi:bleomycin hydrolase
MADKRYEELYTIDFLGNVVEGNIIRYVNLPSEALKKYAIMALRDGMPVWFGCDVGKFFHRTLGVMDTELYDFDLLFGTEFTMDKSIRLEYGDSRMTHAMVFTGVDLREDLPTKWRVENSWGDQPGDKGYFVMSDEWFDEYLYEIAIEKKYLPEEILKIYDREPIKLPPWDPMGALAR